MPSDCRVSGEPPVASPESTKERTLGSLLLLAAPLALLYGPTLRDLVQTWLNDEGASHGLLIPPLAAYLAWLRRDRLLALPVMHTGGGPWLAGLGCLVYLVGKLGVGFFLCQFSLMIVIAGLAWTFWGRLRLRLLAFPLVLLSTMIPAPAALQGTLTMSLQLFTSAAATRLAQMAGIAAYQEGNLIHLAGISLGVAEACSGLRSLSTLVISSLLLGSVYCGSVKSRAALLLSALPISVGINVVRVTGTAILADHRVELAQGFYHSFSGWLTLGLGFLLLWLTAHSLDAMNRRDLPVLRRKAA